MIDWIQKWMHPDWLSNIGVTIDQVVAGSNAIPQAGGILTVLLITVAALQAKGKFGLKTIIQAMGAVLLSVGWFIHRGFWNFSIFNRHSGDAYASWAMDLRLFPATQMLLVMAGTLMVLSRFGHIYFGVIRWWALVLVIYSSWVAYSVYLAT